MKFVCADLPRPNLAEEDGYGGGGVKISVAGASTTMTRSRQWLRLRRAVASAALGCVRESDRGEEEHGGE